MFFKCAWKTPTPFLLHVKNNRGFQCISLLIRLPNTVSLRGRNQPVASIQGNQDELCTWTIGWCYVHLVWWDFFEMLKPAEACTKPSFFIGFYVLLLNLEVSCDFPFNQWPFRVWSTPSWDDGSTFPPMFSWWILHAQNGGKSDLFTLFYVRVKMGHPKNLSEYWRKKKTSSESLQGLSGSETSLFTSPNQVPARQCSCFLQELTELLRMTFTCRIATPAPRWTMELDDYFMSGL